jgi:uncharacterized membrane protein
VVDRLPLRVRELAVATVCFLVLDGIWLGLVAPPLYDALLGDLLAEEPVVWAAVLFYAVFLAGLVHFVIHPAVLVGSVRRAAASGAFFGLVTYATWDLTNLAVIRDFPVALVPIDLAWGAALSASVAATACHVVTRRRVLPEA